MGDFAQYQRLMGLKVVAAGNVYWHEVRPFFYRPLWPLQELRPDTVTPPLRSVLGGVQYAVPADVEANSALNFFVFDDLANYHVNTLSRKPKKQVRLASKEFVVRAITDLGEFQAKGYPVYRSFYERTRYQVLSERKNEAYFRQWAAELFAIPNILVLGGYRGDELGGVGISFLIGDTINYAAVFCDTRALDGHLSDLMLHTIRESASATPHAKQILVGMFKGVQKLDDFKRLRGARLVRQRTLAKLNPFAETSLRMMFPQYYRKLLGFVEDPIAPVAAAVQESKALPGEH